MARSWVQLCVLSVIFGSQADRRLLRDDLTVTMLRSECDIWLF